MGSTAGNQEGPSLRVGRTAALAILVMALLGQAAIPMESGGAPPWTTEVIDSFGGLSSNAGLSATRDSQGRLHVAYYSFRGADLKYAVGTGGDWSVETVDEWMVVGTDCSIALDGDDAPHICYYDRTDEELEYARRNGTTWDMATVDSLGIVGTGTAMACDGDGVPHIAYIGARTLRWARPGGDTWNVTVVDDGETHVANPSIAIDGQGVARILYVSSSGMKMATLEGANWTLQVVDGLQGRMVAMSTKLLLDGKGDPCCCYADRTGSSVVYAHGHEGDWTFHTVDEGFLLGGLDMELDGEGEPRIVYLDIAMTGTGRVINTAVWYAWRSGAGWTKGPVMDLSQVQGVLVDLELDGDDRPTVLYIDLAPIGPEANLVLAEGWTGDYVEPFPRDPSEWGLEDGGTGNGDDGEPILPKAALVVMLAVLFSIVLVILGRRNEGSSGL